jgi:acyl carrier protein
MQQDNSAKKTGSGATSLEKCVVQAIARCSNCAPQTIARDTLLSDLMLDSMSVTIVVSNVGLAFDCAFSDLTLARILQARDVGQMIDGLSDALSAERRAQRTVSAPPRADESGSR